MGCVASRLDEEEEVVSICRERKHQLKIAVERRYALADAHYRYCKSLYGVSAAINFFVSRHSSPPSPFFVTFPPPTPPPSQPKETVVSNPLFLQQTPSGPTKEAIVCESCSRSSTASSDSSEEEDCKDIENQKEQPVCGYFYMDLPQGLGIASPNRDFGWDFFNPFDGVTRHDAINVYNRISEEDLRAVREQEGIPELEDEEGERIEEEEEVSMVRNERVGTMVSTVEVVKVGDDANVRQGEQQQPKGLAIIDTPVGGRELLEALKDIEDHFVKAYESGKDVSRMLECNKIHLQSNLEEIKENSTKLIQAITWRTASSRSSSSKSLVASSSKSSSTWTEFSNDLFDDYGGMTSGSHSLTLGRLYAWEKKLCQEVKDGDSIRRIYERKCNQLRNQDVRGDEGIAVDKTRAAVKDLYSRILVAIRSTETISNQIDMLRDEELEPQIRELLQGMMTTWKIMLECHEIQNKIIFEVKTFNCPSYGKFINESHRRATLQLEIELVNLRAGFMEYITAQKGYIEALYKWLSKFVAPEVEFYSRGQTSAPPCRSVGPPLLTLCHGWLNLINKLPDKSVSLAVKSCYKDVRSLWIQQGKEQQQKRKVDSLSKELDKKASAFKKAENRAFEFRLMDKNTDPETENQAESFIDRKDILDDLRRRVDLEKQKHHDCMKETERITLNAFQTGFCRVFESMTDFSRAAFNMYNELVSNETGETVEKPSSIEGIRVVENCIR